MFEQSAGISRDLRWNLMGLLPPLSAKGCAKEVMMDSQ